MGLKLFYENVTLLDFACWDEKLGPMGNSLRVHVEIEGRTDADGIISDFSTTKKKIKTIIDQYADHKLLINSKLVKSNPKEVVIEADLGDDGELFYRAPAEAVCLMDAESISNSHISQYLEKTILMNLPESISSLKVILEEPKCPSDQYYFHYTHGLKNHRGNCQRLLHGHKNPVRIWVNEKRRSDLEKYLAADVFKGSVHFAFKENIVNLKEIEEAGIIEGSLQEISSVHLKYLSSQGGFEMKLPGKLVSLVNAETSVENLSKYFYAIIREKCDQNAQVKVQAFEGIGKGAIFED